MGHSESFDIIPQSDLDVDSNYSKVKFVEITKGKSRDQPPNSKKGKRAFHMTKEEQSGHTSRIQNYIPLVPS